MPETATNPERVNSIVSDSHFEFSKITTSSTYTTTTECSTKLSTGQEVSPQDSGFSGSNSSDSSGSMSQPFSLQRGLPFDHLNQGTHVLMDTLKHTGYSLINSRYIGGILRPHNREGTSGTSSTASCEQTTTSSTADKSDVIHVTAGKISKTEASKISSLFGRALPGGVSGALTQLRQNGIFWMRESLKDYERPTEVKRGDGWTCGVCLIMLHLITISSQAWVIYLYVHVQSGDLFFVYVAFLYQLFVIHYNKLVLNIKH